MSISKKRKKRVMF